VRRLIAAIVLILAVVTSATAAFAQEGGIMPSWVARNK
jgi:hypothetical protein